ncbi:GMC family oxidoreductase N-terminal domain-containing protein [Planosporangium thailandense]|uniref:GMC family oxidoreductase N-terminal domain-containing protein n=1 Tax=Planosporangium thailandense TaxID=765197 RepID=UPI0030B7FE09
MESQASFGRRRLLTGALGLAATAATGSVIRPGAGWSSTEQQTATTTALIVGAGYAGCVAALRLAQAGVQSVILERGLSWPITPNGTTFATAAKPDGRAAWLSTTSPFTKATLPVYTGVLETYQANGIAALAGAGVGGGSLVNSGVMMEPSENLFNKSFGGTLDYAEMTRVWYPRAHGLIGVAQMPEDVLNSSYYQAALSFYKEIGAAGYSPVKLDMAVDWDTVRQEMAGTKVASFIINDGIWGCNSGAKRSVDRTILASALATGRTSVQTLCRVTDIVPRGTGYVVGYDRIDTSGNVVSHATITTKYVILAAGSLGTTRLLVRAKALGQLPNLDSSVGTNWGNNGDNNALRTGMAYNNPTQGGPSGIAMTDWTANTVGPVTLLNFPWRTPPADGSGAVATLGLSYVPGLGSFAYNSATDSVDLTWPASDPAASSVTQAVTQTLNKLNAADPPSTTSFVNAQMTSHTCGGVSIGRSANSFGAVNGYRNLYVFDSALLPGSTGAVPPALTVTALADRCATALAASAC